MNPGLVVKLRPAGPWRIGPDSGARNRVDVIYHSDSLYSAVTSAMSRMGSLETWLDATARSQTPAVCFSSCFPFIDDIGFVVPPRTLWPPTSPAAMSARVRWKSARFIPLTMVESILSGKKLNENQWTVDGASGCLVPAGKPGPFRTSVRWNAAVDRLSGASERHATACIEFREGCGLWTVVGFPDEAARDQWQEPVKAAFRLLADSGFGGERSRGWGRSETPEFVEGILPGLIIEYRRRTEDRPSSSVPSDAEPGEAETSGPVPPPPVEEPPTEEPPITEPPPAEEPGPAPVPPVEGEASGPVPPTPIEEPPTEEPPITEPPPAEEPGPAPVPPVEGEAVQVTPASAGESEPSSEVAAVTESAATEGVPAATAEGGVTESSEPIGAETAAPEAEGAVAPVAAEAATLEAEGAVAPVAAEVAAPEAEGGVTPVAEETAAPEPEDGVAPVTAEPAATEVKGESPEPVVAEAAVRASDQTRPMRVEPEPSTAPPATTIPLQAHWLLSLFTPATADAVDWGRGSYAVLARGGRIDSPSAGSGELKKQIQMVAEGSVLYSDGVPLGAAFDVAPDGFAHPVFRAGFALAIPLPEVH